MSKRSRARRREHGRKATNPSWSGPLISYADIEGLFRDYLPPDLYASEIAYFESPEDPECRFLVDPAMANLVHVAAERMVDDPGIGRSLVDLATLIWDRGDERARNMILVSFFENFDNLEVVRIKALHRFMKPHMQRMLEDELARFGIDWMR